MSGRIQQPQGDLALTLVVPLYNEEERIAESLARLNQFVLSYPIGSRLILVDDGSEDRTVAVTMAELAKRPDAVVDVLRRPHQGKGAAIRAGLAAATTEMAAFCDVDLSTPLEELGRIISRASSTSCLAIGSRAAKGAAIAQHEARRRELAGKAYNRLVRLLCPGIADTQCGAKAAPTKHWRTLLPHSLEEGFAWDVEIIALAQRVSISVEEIGIAWNHDNRTRVRVIRDGCAMVSALPRIAANIRKVHPEVAYLPSPLPGRRNARPSLSRRIALGLLYLPRDGRQPREFGDQTKRSLDT